MISGFFGEYRWLSNFYPTVVYFDGMRFRTVEHAYQAAKTDDIEKKIEIQKCGSAGEAKKIGKTVELRPNWDNERLRVMEILVRRKFSTNEYLAKKLIETGNQKLEETNTWGDTYWGVCDGTGENHLGTLIMKVRSELQEDGK